MHSWNCNHKMSPHQAGQRLGWLKIAERKKDPSGPHRQSISNLASQLSSHVYIYIYICIEIYTYTQIYSYTSLYMYS